MKEMGEVLRKAREEKGLSLADVQEKLMIRVKYLKALEEGDESSLPEEVYVKGFLKSYARFLDLDPKPLLDEYDRWKGSRYTEEQVIASGAPVPARRSRRRERVESLPAPRTGTRRRRPLPLYVLVGLVGLFLLFSVVTLLLLSPYHGEAPVPASEETASSGSVISPGTDVAPGPGTGPGIEGVEREEDVSDRGASGEAPETEARVMLVEQEGNRLVYRVGGTDRVRVVVKTISRCWIQVTSDGRLMSSETFEKGAVVNWEGEREVYLWIGYPGGIEVEVNGIPLKLSGDRNRPMHLHLKRKGVTP